MRIHIDKLTVPIPVKKLLEMRKNIEVSQPINIQLLLFAVMSLLVGYCLTTGLRNSFLFYLEKDTVMYVAKLLWAVFFFGGYLKVLVSTLIVVVNKLSYTPTEKVDSLYIFKHNFISYMFSVNRSIGIINSADSEANKLIRKKMESLVEGYTIMAVEMQEVATVVIESTEWTKELQKIERSFRTNCTNASNFKPKIEV